MVISIVMPDGLFRQAEALAMARGVTLQRFFTEALLAQLPRGAMKYGGGNAEPPWMAGFGGLSDLGDDHRRMREAIEDEFGRLPPNSLA